MSKEREKNSEGFLTELKKKLWWLLKVGIIAGVSIAALNIAVNLLK